MLIYEKVVNGVRHLFGTNANTPSESDAQLTYKDRNGTVLTNLTFTDTYVNNNDHGITRMSDGKEFSVNIGSTAVIPQGGYPVSENQSTPVVQVKAKEAVKKPEVKKVEPVEFKPEVKEESEEEAPIE